MPIAFNPPPLPSPDTAKAAVTDNTCDAGAPPAGAFSQVLAAAGARQSAESKGQRTIEAAQSESERHNRARVDASEITPDVAAWLAPNAAMISTSPQPKREASAADSRAATGTRHGGAHTEEAAIAAFVPDIQRIDRPMINTDVRPGAEPQQPVRNLADAISPRARDAEDARSSTLGRAVSLAIENSQPAMPSAASTQEPTAGSRLPVQSKIEAIADASGLSPAAVNAPTPATPHAIRQIETVVGAAGWQDEFAQTLAHVVVLGSDNVQFRMHPAELGPVDIAINVASDHASLLITAAHQATRDALEQALPQLRDMLANQGITLGQATVQGDGRDAQAFAEWRANAGTVGRGAIGTVAADPSLTLRLDRLIDVFA